MDLSKNQNDITLRDTIRVIFKYKWSILLTFIVTMVATYIGMEIKTPTFKAKVKMLVSAKKQIDSTYYRELLDFRQSNIALTQSEIVISQPVLRRAMEAMNLDERPLNYEDQFASPVKLQLSEYMRKLIEVYDRIYAFIMGAKVKPPPNRYIENLKKLKENIEIEAIKDTDIFLITVTDFDPGAAMHIANVISRSYVIFDLEQQLAELQQKFGYKHLAVTQLKDTIRHMTYHLSGELRPTLEAIGPASIKIIDQADIPTKPVGKPKIFIYLIAVPLGLFLGVVLAFIYEYLDQTFKSPSEVERELEVPVLGSLPKRKFLKPTLINKLDGKGNYIKAYKDLSDQIFLLLTDEEIPTLLFTTADSKNDDAHIIANLGLNLAHNGNKVLLIDANFRKPSLHKIFKIPNEKGLSDIISDKVRVEEALQSSFQDLMVLPAGETNMNPITLLGSYKLKILMEQLSKDYDMIFLCTSNMAEYKDAAILARSVNHIVVVLIDGYSRRQSVQIALTPILRSGARLLGAILTERVYVIPKSIYRRI